MKQVTWAALTIACLVQPACNSKNGMVQIAANSVQETSTNFMMDQYEAVVVNKKVVDSATGAEATLPIGESRIGVLPTAGVTFTEAKKYCADAGKRICTMKEWLTACAGPKNYRSGLQATPTSPGLIDKKCYLNQAVPNFETGEPAKLVKTGSYSQCQTSGLSVHDLIGNVSEWVVDEATSDGRAMGPNAYSPLNEGVCNTYVKDDTNNDGDGDAPIANDANLPVVGFRCCANPS